MSTRRWPLHPRPGPLESLSSWLERLARPYNLSVDALLAHNLDLGGVAVPALLDHDPPAVLLAALADRTGVELAQLRAMTWGGWVPWLFDKLWVRPHDAQEVFDTYVRQNSVLLAPVRPAAIWCRGGRSGPGRGSPWCRRSTGPARSAPPTRTGARPWCGSCR